MSDRAHPARLKLKPSEVCTARTAVRTKKKKSNEIREGIRMSCARTDFTRERATQRESERGI